MKRYVLDTHTLVWYLANDPRLGEQAEAILDDADSQLVIPAIVLAEIKHLTHKGRFAEQFDNVLEVLSKDPRCLIYPIDARVVSSAPVTLDIHDSLIVGVALVQSEPVDGILSRDEAISESGFVPVIW